MLGFRSPVSAYLVPSNHKTRRQPDWQALRTVAAQILRDNPRLFGRSLIALAVWCVVVGLWQTTMGISLSDSHTQWQHAQNPSQRGGLASNTSPTTEVAGASLAKAEHASLLASGPSGQLLPPGTMASDRTYPNNYARGQCTSYVAGRRQIPPNWGNAVSWYYHAISSKWSVGTVPAVAAIAWTSQGRYGHVALVEQVSADAKSVYISEMNYRGVGVKSFRWAAAREFKYIY
ncbi:MAG TPA: CHAP domain-containing protein [Candidatus Saccharimonadia bacterium]|nr:CHAP domain-containing protein [Candidatus Saccharimonadia bacterium]